MLIPKDSILKILCFLLYCLDPGMTGRNYNECNLAAFLAVDEQGHKKCFESSFHR